jgi:hypothetical protein
MAVLPFIYCVSIGFKNGGLAGTRTLDQCLKRALLYQLSYQPTEFREDGTEVTCGLLKRVGKASQRWPWAQGFLVKFRAF